MVCMRFGITPGGTAWPGGEIYFNEHVNILHVSAPLLKDIQHHILYHLSRLHILKTRGQEMLYLCRKDPREFQISFP